MLSKLGRRTQLTILILLLVAVGQIIVSWPDDLLHVVVCDVGQGDAILISHRQTQLLIDGGRDNKVLTCLRQHMPWSDKTLEIVLATHADSDHTGGLEEVIEQFSPQLVILPLCYKNTARFSSLYELVQRKKLTGLDVKYIQQISDLDLDNQLTVTRLWPEVREDQKLPGCQAFPKTTLQDTQTESHSNIDDTNAWSSVLLLRYHQMRILLTADIDAQVEQALIADDLLERVNILKVAHHGSKTATSQALIDRVQPETSLISVGKNNSYKHPAPEVIARLRANRVKVWRTDLSGTLEVISDGQSYRVKEQSTGQLFNWTLLFHFLSTKTSSKID